MIKVQYISTAQRFPQEVVADDVTLRQFLEGKNAYAGATFSLNGKTLRGDVLDMSFGDLKAANVFSDVALLNETAKTTGAY